LKNRLCYIYLMRSVAFKDIDEYITASSEEVQEKLEQIRGTIKKAAPKAEEVISYQMPAFKLHKVLVYFAGFKNHIGFYPTASGIAAFEKDLAPYKWSKGAVQFPLDKPLPIKLITDIVKFRVKEDKVKALSKKTKT
jgi:uncharacterized protein YdhG (YjbR/CyaY superfamily)